MIPDLKDQTATATITIEIPPIPHYHQTLKNPLFLPEWAIG